MFTTHPIAFSCPPLLAPVLALVAGIAIALDGCPAPRRDGPAPGVTVESSSGTR